ncbi:MAG: PQQ-dependent sugar dehydrogenase [Dehalococcoidales bacterium]|nr:PQQ-dependent sugar dehydrogenase [Dehalococcoidales bacterium]
MNHLTRRKVLATLFITFAILILISTGLIWWNFRAGRVTDLPPVPSVTETPAAEPPAENQTPAEIPLASSLAQNLEIPWALDFLPDGSIVFTERPGRVRLIDAREGLLSRPLLTIDEVAHRGEGGLLGIAVPPEFAGNHFIYLYYTYQENESLANRVVRFNFENSALVNEKVIIDHIPGASIHNGGRIKFGPDGLLYITTGDASDADLAQDKNSLAGKILRLEDDGTIPPDNPFPGSPVYSFGHRNPQGIAWDDQGRLWATEHGSSATDELNLIEPGKNYGWPIVRGDEQTAGLESPVIHSDGETWAPSGLAFFNGSLFFAGLRGQSLYQATIGNQKVALQRHLDRNFGRLRDVVVGPDNMLYILTSNRDGRAVPTSQDDRILRINPGKL